MYIIYYNNNDNSLRIKVENHLGHIIVRKKLIGKQFIHVEDVCCF